MNDESSNAFNDKSAEARAIERINSGVDSREWEVVVSAEDRINPGEIRRRMKKYKRYEARYFHVRNLRFTKLGTEYWEPEDSYYFCRRCGLLAFYDIATQNHTCSDCKAVEEEDERTQETDW